VGIEDSNDLVQDLQQAFFSAELSLLTNAFCSGNGNMFAIFTFEDEGGDEEEREETLLIGLETFP
jgi:hypothetical protein